MHTTSEKTAKQKMILAKAVSKQGEIALTLIRITTSLETLAGGDTTWMQHFMKSSNKLTNGIPVEQIQNAQGLFSVLQLLEGLRAKL